MPQKLLEYAKKNYTIIENKDMYDYAFGGGNGEKWVWTFKETQVPYMFKEQIRNPVEKPKEKIDKTIVDSYNNSILSEYVGSQVINKINFKNIVAQNTKLVYNKEKDKVFVACEIIGEISTTPRYALKPVSLLSNVKFGSKYLNENQEQQFGGVKIGNVIDWINNSQNFIEPEILLDYFYNMFVIDTFILNWDRNFTNWGLVIDNNTKEYHLSPLFDQGGSLLAKQDFKDFELINDLKNDRDVDMIFQKTKSFFKYDESKNTINYAHFLTTTTNIELLLVYNDFINHMKNVNIQEIINSLSIPQEYKQTYTKLLERSLFNINKFVNLNPLYKEILKKQENNQDQNNKKKIKKETKSSLSR